MLINNHRAQSCRLGLHDSQDTHPIHNPIHHTLSRSLWVIILAVITGFGTVGYADPPPGKGNPNKGNPNTGNPNAGNPNQHNAPQLWIDKSSRNSTIDLITASISIVAARALAIDAGAVGFKPLPPGIAKNLARGKPLPPGIVTRNLPQNLLRGLPRYDGYQWLAAGADLILINTASRLVADVLTDALR